MDPNTRLRNLMVMALADGSLGEREVQLVTDRCAELGLGEHELRDAIRYALEDRAAIRLPDDPMEGESLLGDLLRVMAADGVLEESEKRLFAICAAKLGFGSNEIDALVDRLLKK
jgi:uncharacterized tellurite resistance protein B-like protein